MSIDWKTYSDVDIYDRQLVLQKPKFKFPPLELKNFGREIKDWLKFWDQFRKTDKDTDIDEVDKFQI